MPYNWSIADACEIPKDFLELANSDTLLARLLMNRGVTNTSLASYFLDLNAREMINQNQKLKLTEKEINSINYLFNVKKPVKVQELQLKVWGYQSNLETHTVETHIYRLRKKILNKFKDNNFIGSTVDGYQIK